MKIVETTLLSNCEKEIAYKLWNNEYPKKLAYKNLPEFESYLNSLTETTHLLLIRGIGEIVGWAFTFKRENSKWFAIILNSIAQRQGNGTLLLNKLKEKEDVLNGWVIDHNGEIKNNDEQYKSPLKFYEKNGFVTCSETRLELNKISAVKILWSSK